MTTNLTLDEQVAEWAGDLCILPPLDLCSEKAPPNPKASKQRGQRCIRAPHDNDWHVYAGWVER